MSGKPAARTGDLHVCPMVTGIIPHVGGPVIAMQMKVFAGGMPAARMGDVAVCVGPPDSIVKGAFPVPIEMKPAARQTDQTAHGGVIALGCPTVEIGLAGTTGNPRVGTALCLLAANGRPGGTLQQSNGNCGVESSRQLIQGLNPTPAAQTQAGLLNQSAAAGDADMFASNGTLLPANQIGGTTPAGQVSILARNGVGARTIGQGAEGMANMQTALSAGQGVIVNLDAAPLWSPTMTPAQIAAQGPPPWGHAVVLTGIDYDDNGNPIQVHYNDTGRGQCGATAPYATFASALNANAKWDSVATNSQPY